MNTIIQRIKTIECEQKRRYQNNAISRYNKGDKVHKKQLEFHKCLKRNRWVFGGNRTGKTECGAVESVWLARGIHPYRKNKDSVNGWIVSLSTRVQRDVAQKKFLSYLNPDWIVDVVMESGKKDNMSGGIIDYIVIKNISGKNSIIGFKSCDQGREKFQGTSLDFVWFDEEPPYDIYLECKMRVIDTVGDIFGTMTPLMGLTWVYNEIYLNENNDDNIWHIQMQWEDNPFLNQQEILSLSSSMSSQELDARKYGNFTFSGGRVYQEFNENVNVVEPFNIPSEWQDTISIDPGLKNPLSAHWYAVDFDSNVYVIAEHFESGKSVQYHAEKIKQKCKQLNWKMTTNGMYAALIDSAATQRTLSSEKSVVDLFYDNGILVNPKVNKDLFSGINKVKSYLKNVNGETKLFIFKNCTNLIREFKNYFWGNSDVPIKDDDHALDELRYYIMSKPENKNFKSIKTDIQKDKEKLFKKLSSRRRY